MDKCVTCGHMRGWHLTADGPNPSCCNNPGCRCAAYAKEK